jgi:hypothetical protein
MRIIVTAIELVERDLVDDFCRLLGVDESIVISDKTHPMDTISLTPEQAVALGLIEEGERW